MANGAIRLTWRDRNWAEQGHYIYRSDTPMDVNNLPSPIATVGVNEYEYIDYDVIVDNTYYYRIGAFRNSDVSVSDEISIVAIPGIYTTTHDAFADGSAVATYNFDGNAIDLGSTSIAIQPYTYANGKFGGAIDLGSYATGLSTVTGLETLTAGDYSMSAWLNLNGNYQNNGYILVQTTGQGSQQNVLLRVYDNMLDLYDNVTGISYSSNAVFNNNDWVHVVVTYTVATKELFMYINGVLDSTHIINGFTLQNQTIYFGSWATGAYRYTGLLDQLRIFNKVLSPTEVEDLFYEVE